MPHGFTRQGGNPGGAYYRRVTSSRHDWTQLHGVVGKDLESRYDKVFRCSCSPDTTAQGAESLDIDPLYTA